MSITIAMVLFGENPRISGTAITRDLAANWSDLPPIGKVDKKDLTLAFSLGGDDVIMGLMGAPFPWSDLEGPCATSVLFPNAAETLRKHKSHLIVTVRSDKTPLERMSLLTKVVAAVVGTCPQAVGIYWGSSTLVLRPDIFRQFAIEILPHGPPVMMWIDFRVGKNPDGTSSGFTQGMDALELMDLETTNASDEPGDLRERFESLVGYLLENGPVIKDGDTVGADENEKIKVIYGPSAFGNKNQVMRLDYQRTQKSFFKPW